MKIHYAFAAVLFATAVGLPALAQTLPAESPFAPTAAPRKTLLKLGTCLSRGFQLGGYSGLALPLTLGMERRLSSKFTAYANLTTALRLVRPRYGDRTFISRGIGELGGRYYYNQAKRTKKGRPSGPFVGNYLALQASTDLTPLYRQNTYSPNHYLRYDFSALTALWGMQRQLGHLFVYDLNAGLGVYNPYRVRYDPATDLLTSRRRLLVLPELALRLSLAH